MRNVLLGTLAGLVIGTVSALAYSHYFGDGKLLAGLQAQLDAANANLAKAAQEKQRLASETSSVSDQVDHLLAANEELKHQLDGSQKPSAPVVAAPTINPMVFAGMMRGGFQSQQRLFLLQSRLHLTPDQAAIVKAAMDADAKQRQELGRQMFRGGTVDPQAVAKANTLDQTLATILTPDQQAAYKQVQTDEQTSRASTSATTQLNQVAPLLQLSDAQKDQVYTQLYQVDMAAPDPTSLMTNPNAPSVLAKQSQAIQDALSKVLSTDQMTLYQEQQAQSLSRYGGGGRRRGGAAAPAQ